MRILTGKYKGKGIRFVPKIRPTQGLVRKALFDILGDIEGLLFLELFAGSGAVGLEALSRGAKQVLFVENNSDCLKALKSNFTYLIPDTYCLLPMDVYQAVKKLHKDKRQFDIIFLDPPYYMGTSKKTLQMLGAYDILAPYGLVVVQHFKKDILPNAAGELTLFKQARYGDTVLSFYRKGDK